MKIKLLLFASAREIVGKEEVEIEFEEGTKLRDCKSRMIKMFPPLEKIIHRCSMAVNMDIKKDEYILREGDEIAILPPVSGGDG